MRCYGIIIIKTEPRLGNFNEDSRSPGAPHAFPLEDETIGLDPSNPLLLPPYPESTYFDRKIALECLWIPL